MIETLPPDCVTEFTYSYADCIQINHLENLLKAKMSILFVIADGRGMHVWSEIDGVLISEYQEERKEESP